MATPFRAELVTPERVLFSGEADEVSLRTDGGEVAFLANHSELVAAIDITVVRIRSLEGRAGEGGEPEGEEVRFAAHGGFVHVGGNAVQILAGVAERGDEIDVERARQALASARERFAAEGPASADAGRPEAAVEQPVSESPCASPARPLSGAMLALLAPGSAEAAVRRAEIRLEAAGARAEA